jgi:hypothetical protein
MQKPNNTAATAPKNRTAANKSTTKNNNRMYTQGKKIADKVMNIFNYQYKDSDLEQFVF